MSELADVARLRALIPRPGGTGRLPVRRDQRRPPSGHAAPPPELPEDSAASRGEAPHVDEYV